MDRQEFLTEEFEAHRSHLRAVAYRMLGSTAEADDAVQESWFRLARADTVAGIDLVMDPASIEQLDIVVGGAA